MNTKRLLIGFAFMLLAIGSYAQGYSEKLLVRYSDSEIQQMQKDNQEGFNLLNYFVTEGCLIVDMPEKSIEYQELHKVDPKTGVTDKNYVFTSEDCQNFNPLQYNCTYQPLKRSYYKIGETGKLLIIPSMQSLRNRAENKSRVENNK